MSRICNLLDTSILKRRRIGNSCMIYERITDGDKKFTYYKRRKMRNEQIKIKEGQTSLQS